MEGRSTAHEGVSAQMQGQRMAPVVPVLVPDRRANGLARDRRRCTRELMTNAGIAYWEPDCFVASGPVHHRFLRQNRPASKGATTQTGCPQGGRGQHLFAAECQPRNTENSELIEVTSSSAQSGWNDRLTPGPWVTLDPGDRNQTQSHNGGVGHEQLYPISRSGCPR